MRTRARPFQRRGVRFLLRRNGRGLIADEPGLGKTYQAVAWLALNPDVRPVLIVCPSSVRWVWQRELRVHAGLRSAVLQGRSPYDVDRGIFIINYDVVADWEQWFRHRKPAALILDEVHKIKNRNTNRTKACRRIARRTKAIIGLTGTPVRNRPAEFWPILNMIAPRRFSSFWDYAFRYCDPKPGFRGRGWDVTGASNLDELATILRSYMLRRTRTQVAKELPSKVHCIVPVELTNSKTYSETVDQMRSSDTKQTILETVTQQLSIVGEGKIAAAVDWIEEFLSETEEKLVVFTTHRKVISELRERFPASVAVEGSTSYAQRAGEVDCFQNDPNCRLFFGNIRAAGEGLTLHAASTVLFVELSWVPGEMDQAADRVLRIGQRARNILVYQLVARNTIDQKIVKALKKKRSVIEQIMRDRDRVRTHQESTCGAEKAETKGA